MAPNDRGSLACLADLASGPKRIEPRAAGSVEDPQPAPKLVVADMDHSLVVTLEGPIGQLPEGIRVLRAPLGH